MVATYQAAVPASRVTWQFKFGKLVGYPKKGATTRAARKLKRSPQTVYHWFAHGMTPQDEEAVLDEIVRAYGVTRGWLKNGIDDAPPIIGKAATPALIELVEQAALPEELKQVIYALTDERAAAFLVKQLRVFRETVGARRQA